MLDIARPIPPANVEVEQALLGAVLIDNDVMDRIAGVVEPDDFSEALHANLFAIMRTERAAGRTITPVTLKPFVGGWPSIADGVDASRYLVRLATGAVTTMNAVAYAEGVRDFAARRGLFVLGEDLIRASANAEASVRDIASSAVTALDGVLAVTRAKRSAVSIGDAMLNVLDRALNDDGSSRITSGCRDLDKVLSGGFRRKQYAIVAGRPSMGKTTLATSLMLRTARAGHGVLMLSLEMATDEVAARAITDLSYGGARRIAYNALIANDLNQGDWSVIGDAARDFRGLPIVVDDQRGLTIAEIGSRIRAQQQRFERDGKKLGLVVVDHLGFIRASERYRGNRVHEVTEISAGLGQIAKDLDIALVVLCQLNRGTEGRDNKRPTLADLRDSGSLEQDADVVIFCFREAYYLERMRCDPGSTAEDARLAELEACRNTMDLLVSKNRNGPTSTVTVFCDMASNAVRDLA